MNKRVVFTMALLALLLFAPAVSAGIIEQSSSSLEKVLLTNVRLLPAGDDYRMTVELERTRGGSVDDVQVVVFLYNAPWGAFFSEKKDLVRSETFNLFLDGRDVRGPGYNLADDYLIINVYGDGFKKTRVLPANLFI